MENGTMEYGYNIQQANTAPNSPNLSSGNSSPLPGTPNQIYDQDYFETIHPIQINSNSIALLPRDLMSIILVYFMKSGSLVFIVGSIIQTSALNLVMLLIGRFVGGIGIGILSMACPMYMGEISPNNIRGALLCLEEFNIVFGIVVAFWITDNNITRTFSFTLITIMVSKSKTIQKCLETISILRQLPMDDRSVRQEWIDIRVEAEFQREINLARFGELPEDAWSLLKIEFRKWGDTFSKDSPTLFETLGLDVEKKTIITTRQYTDGGLSPVNVAILIWRYSADWSQHQSAGWAGVGFLLLPETAYRSLEEMDQVFGDKLAVEDQLKKSQLFHKIVSEEELQ
ncbi:hypothetical protein H4Q26_014926 [Puccinia striiformis f. sp. tritici PST-130]|nr:hypothetical protein H4Q26_014926 [Puccinia striiformis f. sp. tritici PST-130]